MKLKEVVRTATFAWSPLSEPALATGTVSGALDASFSNDAHLEIWRPDLQDGNVTLGNEGGLKASGIVTTSARFNRLAWGHVHADRPEGVIAAGLESGHLELWDAAQITQDIDINVARLLQNQTHTGPVRALHFNPLQPSLLSSGSSIGSELYIWDLKNPSTPYTPGARSQRLEGISSLAWNAQVAHILASSSPSGYTVVWDLRGKREVVGLQYGGGGVGGGGPPGAGPAGVGGLRRGMSDVAWHPDNATRLIIASEDDSSPVLTLWDLRNARAPEKILTGHDRGVLSLSWNTADPDLLLSCGKDNRTICWNPSSGEIVGQLPPSNNWSFQTSWNVKNPSLFATANYDGSIGIHSIQSTSSPVPSTPSSRGPVNPNDVFDPANFTDTTNDQNLGASLSLERAPKWLRVPVGARFGFGGRVVEVRNTEEGEKKERKVTIRKIVAEESVVKRAKELVDAEKDGSMKSFVEDRAKSNTEDQAWSALLALFDPDPKAALVQLVGYDTSPAALDEALAAVRAKTYEPVVSFAAEAVHVPHSPVAEAEGEDKDEDDSEAGTDVPGAAPSEVSAFSSDAKPVDSASTATEPSLFGDEPVQAAAGGAVGDFFDTLGTGSHDASTIRPRAGLVPHLSYTGESSAAATIGSRGSSVAGDIPTTPSVIPKSFRLHPKKEDATSALVTRALITRNLDTAVELCIQAGRWADALLLAQGEGLVMKTRMAYFEHQAQAEGGYLRVFKGVVQGRKGLTELVRGADVAEWKEVLVVLCRWAEDEVFSSLVGELGERVLAEGGEGKRDAARVCFVAGKRLDKLVKIWEEELKEEQEKGELYSVRAEAVQHFVEKAVAFTSATSFADSEAKDGEDYILKGLYDRYLEYAEILASQGLVDEARAYVKRVPKDVGEGGWLRGALEEGTKPAAPAAAKGHGVSASVGGPYGAPTYGAANSGPYGTPAQSGPYGAPSNTGPYGSSTSHAGPYGAPPAPSNGPYGAPPLTNAGPYGAPPRTGSTGPYGTPAGQSSSNVYGAPPPAAPGPYAPPPSTNNAGPKPYPQPGQQGPYGAPSQPGPYGAPGQQQGGYNGPGQQGPYGAQSGFQSTQPGFRPPMVAVPPPPAPIDGQSPTTSAPTLPPSRQRVKPEHGWNDAPNVTVPQRRTPAPAGPPAAAITSPFPNSPAPGSPAGYGDKSFLPPPPRAGSGTPQRAISPPQAQGPPPRGFGGPPPPRPGSGAAGSGFVPPPPPAGSGFAPPPAAGGYAPPPPTTSAYAPPPQAGGAYAPPPPAAAPPPPSGPYAPPPGHANAPPPPPAAGGAHPPPPPPGQGTNWAPQGPPPGGAPRTGTPTAPPAKAAPKAPKYPPGDRDHIPETDRLIFEVLSEHLARLRQNTPPQQKRMVDDIERRLNVLFDALNCETLSRPVVDQLITLVEAMRAGDGPGATSIHVDLLTRGSRTDDIGLWMSGVKQLIIRM
ncbi:transporter protein Sec31 [Ceratobasidium sp. AG-Ba]|nr:transporter protein Sec31 [Ceratobasidium sp. AG-Ba]